MRMFFSLAIALCLTSAQVLAAATPSPNGLGGPMAKCTANDPAVILNATSMMYMLDTKANRTAMKGMMERDKFICRSAAVKMGATMKTSSPSMMATPGKM